MSTRATISNGDGRPLHQTIEQLTGRDVVALLSQAHVEADIALEIFFVDGPLKGSGTLELIQPE